ncbi:hypothetical protein Tco_0045733 [Tanacetum coccineum]
MFRGDRIGFKETMLGGQLLQGTGELKTELVVQMLGKESQSSVTTAMGLDMAQNEDSIFQADQCDAFDSNVDEAPTAQTMFLANLSSADSVYNFVVIQLDHHSKDESGKGFKREVN